MKVLYDSQCFDMQKSGGVSRYFFELLRNARKAGFDFELSATVSNNAYLAQSDFVHVEKIPCYEDFMPRLNFRGKGRLFKLRNKLLRVKRDNKFDNIAALKRGDFDIFHPTYYDPYFLDYIGSKPFVLTIHDMIHEKFPEFFMRTGDDTAEKKRLLASKAARIVAVSECTKRDIIDILGVPADKIDVVYHGASPLFSDALLPNAYGAYFLYTGARSAYKNFYFMLVALSDFLRGRSDINIVCTSNEFTVHEKDFIRSLGLEKQVRHVFFNNDKEMYSLYKNAVAFIFPSYYEGFGIPILEAFSADCPCVLADASCFREVAGDAALYFEPKDKGALVNCCRTLLENEATRNALSAKGKERVKFFSWEDCAAATKNVYVRAIGYEV